jgi:hypothetical protein
MGNLIDVGMHLLGETVDVRLIFAQVLGDRRPTACVKIEGLNIYLASREQVEQIQSVLTEAAARLDAMTAELAAKTGKA